MFDFLFNPQGRISRKGWWLGYFLPYLAISLVLRFLEGIVAAVAVIGFLVGVFYLWPGLVAVPVKRFHDQGMTGFWQLGFVVLSLVVTIVFFTAVAMYGGAAGMEDEMAGMSALPEDEQMALVWEMVGGAMGTTVGLVSAILLGLLTLAYLYVMGVRPGQAGPNRHGEDPHASGRGFSD